MKFLITGGTGSVGHAICKQLLLNDSVSEIIIYSRNIKEQMTMKNMFNNKKIKYIPGDIKDFNSIYLATVGVDYVIHTAANKHIDIAAETPFESTEINVNGTINVINACIQNKVKSMILTSSDKACAPTSLYGTSKLLAEKNVILANELSETKFSALRYGNVIGSNGSIFKKWNNSISTGEDIYVTDKAMTRFFIYDDQAAAFCISSLMMAKGGELFLPKMKSASIYDIAKTICPEDKIKVSGLRKTEKLHEGLICEQDVGTIEELEDIYIIHPTSKIHGVNIDSSNNKYWFSQEEMKGFFK
jgi:UDP-N-acetylglucosamine 4,6-dehydratase